MHALEGALCACCSWRVCTAICGVFHEGSVACLLAHFWQSRCTKPARAAGACAQAGRPKTITGFQTHTTPVLLSVGDRAELATTKYIPLSSVLEGIVILRENPNYVESSQD